MEQRAARGIHIRGEDTAAPEGTYTIETLCENCDWLGEVEIPKGTAIKRGDSVGRYARCDECGCYTLLRCVQVEDEEDEEEVAIDPSGQAPIRPVEPYDNSLSEPWSRHPRFGLVPARPHQRTQIQCNDGTVGKAGGILPAPQVPIMQVPPIIDDNDF